MPSRQVTDDGLEAHFQINYLGHHLLTQLLLPALLQAGTVEQPARVICTASNTHAVKPLDLADLQSEKGVYSRWEVYGKSKLAQLYLATGLDCRYCQRNVRAFAVHPGICMTALADNLPEDILQRTKHAPEMQHIIKSTQQGAASAIWAAFSPDLKHKGGLYIEDCAVAIAADSRNRLAGGSAEWAYDAQAASAL